MGLGAAYGKLKTRRHGDSGYSWLGLHFFSSDVRAKSVMVVFPSTGVTFSSVFFRSL